jgi:glycosyltransferase involved in cell wall biosynthesis
MVLQSKKIASVPTGINQLFAMFITYDGLLDKLGSSQILPYLRGIASTQGRMVVLSFEKPERFVLGHKTMAAELKMYSIMWKPLRFTSGFGALGKLWDLARMYFWGAWLAYRENIRVIHARGHPTAQVGLFIKRVLGTQLIFDCRGLWVDERVDKGGWDMSRTMHRLQYHHFKKVEGKLFARADQVVVLTHKVVDEVVKLGALPASKVTVIPCCADFDHFSLSTDARKALAREALGISQTARVIGYLGSVGQMYLLDRFFRLFELAASEYEDVCALVITQDIEALHQLIKRNLPVTLHERVHIKSTSWAEVPNILPALDVLVSFIQPSYARMAASPTKLAECFATGIPAICNAGVGDVAMHIKQLSAGIIVDSVSEDDLIAIVPRLDEICAMGGQRLRHLARPLLGLELAHERYRYVYSKLN